MDFLIDENLPNSLSEELRNEGFEAKNIRELDRRGDPDTKVFKTAVENKAILITRDLEFGSPEHYEIEKYEGLVIVRLDITSANQITDKTINSLQQIGFKELENKITVLEEGRYRTREV